ncbi:hypothetical protein M9458_019206, partial [Cirrhinus mrigala]
MGKKPRPVIIRLHYYQQKELIIREARAKRGKLVYQGSPVAIYKDYAPEVATHALNTNPLWRSYITLVSSQLSFPARLFIWTKDR